MRNIRSFCSGSVIVHEIGIFDPGVAVSMRSLRRPIGSIILLPSQSPNDEEKTRETVRLVWVPCGIAIRTPNLFSKARDRPAQDVRGRQTSGAVQVQGGMGTLNVRRGWVRH